MKPFFDHYLKDAPDPHTPHVLTYATGIEPMGGEPALADGHADAALSDRTAWARASTGPARPGTTIMSPIPAKPVPFIPRPIDMGDDDQWQAWLVHDQRFVDRPAGRSRLHRRRR